MAAPVRTAILELCRPVLLVPVVGGLLPAEILGCARPVWRVPRVVKGFIGENVADEDL